MRKLVISIFRLLFLILSVLLGFFLVKTWKANKPNLKPQLEKIKERIAKRVGEKKQEDKEFKYLINAIESILQDKDINIHKIVSKLSTSL